MPTAPLSVLRLLSSPNTPPDAQNWHSGCEAALEKPAPAGVSSQRLTSWTSISKAPSFPSLGVLLVNGKFSVGPLGGNLSCKNLGAAGRCREGERQLTWLRSKSPPFLKEAPGTGPRKQIPKSNCLATARLGSEPGSTVHSPGRLSTHTFLRPSFLLCKIGIKTST